ncbi:MAG: addiction module toxin RelE/StbE [bacterium]|nr:MAG: addiction module toxin RelE/StbE [bacterium]
MQLIWSRRAVADLQTIRAYIAKDNFKAATDVAEHIMSASDALIEYPNMGRVGRIYNTREWVVSELPYILVYKATSTTIHILHVIHTSRNWPM